LLTALHPPLSQVCFDDGGGGASVAVLPGLPGSLRETFTGGFTEKSAGASGSSGGGGGGRLPGSM